MVHIIRFGRLGSFEFAPVNDNHFPLLFSILQVKPTGEPASPSPLGIPSLATDARGRNAWPVRVDSFVSGRFLEKFSPDVGNEGFLFGLPHLLLWCVCVGVFGIMICN